MRTTSAATPQPSTTTASTTTSPASRGERPRRALVLGGGGSTGNAWLIGIVAGLADAGLDVTDADLVVGTSAGATAAAQLAGARPAELLAAVLDAPAVRAVDGSAASSPAFGGSATRHLERLRAVIAASADADAMRRAMGARALEMIAGSDGAEQVRWRSTVAARLPSARWPERAMLLTAVDARSGVPVLFDRSSGVELVDAVAASCAGGFAYRVGDVDCIDGGYRRNENADLAAGADRVLVLSPLGGRSLHPDAWRMQLAAQVDDLRAGGSRVETVIPSRDAEPLLGANAMDASLRPAAARAGLEQGRRIAARLSAFWRS